MPRLTRRSTVLGLAASGGSSLAMPAIAQDQPFRIGLLLPFSGASAAIGEAISSGFDLYTREIGGKMGGRAVELTRLDDASDPARASSNINRILGREKAQALIGSVHDGVVTALARAAKDQQLPLIIPHAGNLAATRELCGATVFRSAFTHWQSAYAIGKAVAETGVKTAAWATWDTPGGKESTEGFREGLRTRGVELTKVLTLMFPELNLQRLLPRLSGLGADAIGAFFSGETAMQFVKGYAAAGLRGKIPLYGHGFLTEGLLSALGPDAEGVRTALPYGDGIDNARNIAFRDAYKAFTNRNANAFAVHGYDAAQILAAGLDAVKGDITEIKTFADSVRGAKIDSPRGAFTMSATHAPIQTFWLREAKAGENQVISPIAETLADPGTGCAV